MTRNLFLKAWVSHTRPSAFIEFDRLRFRWDRSHTTVVPPDSCIAPTTQPLPFAYCRQIASPTERTGFDDHFFHALTLLFLGIPRASSNGRLLNPLAFSLVPVASPRTFVLSFTWDAGAGDPRPGTAPSIR
jgi:hypothetical protein